MKKAALFKELVATYQKHGWVLRGALMQSQTRAELSSAQLESFESGRIKDSTIDALWFSRPSHHHREAWELRLVAETQYALFETFEADETEEQRDEVRLEMEARLRDYVGGKEERAKG